MELVWNGKTNEVCNVVLPFQVIEQVDEPRAEKPEDYGDAVGPVLYGQPRPPTQGAGPTNSSGAAAGNLGTGLEDKRLTTNLSKTQIDRLGDRLKGGPHTEDDLRLLDDYRRSFSEAYETVVQGMSQQGLLPTGRPAKSTGSIVEKLRRESIRLSQMQDIAGCRVVVTGVVEQERVIASLTAVFHEASVMDRREKPSYGYRAVHIIANIFGKPVEIQVRTALQHGWAEVSEKASDVVDATIKYGGGPEFLRSRLSGSSEAVADYEKLERVQEELEKAVAELQKHHVSEQDVKKMQKRLVRSRRDMERLRKLNIDGLNDLLSWLDGIQGEKQ